MLIVCQCRIFSCLSFYHEFGRFSNGYDINRFPIKNPAKKAACPLYMAEPIPETSKKATPMAAVPTPMPTARRSVVRLAGRPTLWLWYGELLGWRYFLRRISGWYREGQGRICLPGTQRFGLCFRQQMGDGASDYQ